jgi:hypothetical protein
MIANQEMEQVLRLWSNQLGCSTLFFHVLTLRNSGIVRTKPWQTRVVLMIVILPKLPLQMDIMSCSADKVDFAKTELESSLEQDHNCKWCR